MTEVWQSWLFSFIKLNPFFWEQASEQTSKSGCSGMVFEILLLWISFSSSLILSLLIARLCANASALMILFVEKWTIRKNADDLDPLTWQHKIHALETDEWFILVSPTMCPSQVQTHVHNRRGCSNWRVL